MSEVLMANIFFVITGTAIVVASVLLSLVLYQIWKITRVLRRVSERIEVGATRIAADASALKKELTSGKLFGKLIQFAISLGSQGFDAIIEHATGGDDEPKKKKGTKVRHTTKTATRKTSKATAKKTKMKIKNLD